MPPQAKLEVKVGIFVFLGLLILTVIVFFVGDFYFFKPGYNIRIIFGTVNGVEKASPVRLAGVKMGEIKDIRIIYDEKENKTKVELLAWLKSEAKIPQDSQARINSLGLLGEKYIEILPGRNYSSFLKEGDVLKGRDPVLMEEIADLGKSIALKLDEGIASINEVIKDEELRGSLKEVFGDLKELTSSAESILTRIKDGKGTIGKLVCDEEVYELVKSILKDIRAHPWKLLRKPRRRSR